MASKPLSSDKQMAAPADEPAASELEKKLAADTDAVRRTAGDKPAARVLFDFEDPADLKAWSNLDPRDGKVKEPPIRIEPSECRLWDRRFAAALPIAADRGFALGYFGRFGAAMPERRDASQADDLPRLVHAVLPASWDEHGLRAVPHLGYRRTGAEVLPCVLFRPAHPLAQAGFTVV